MTGNAGAVVNLKRDNAARTWAGQIAGGLGLVVSGQNTWTVTQPQTYSGPTLINLAGGQVTLLNNGAFQNTSSLTINRSTLALDNNSGTIDLPTRLSASLPISLGGGTLSYIGRTQYNSAETVGAVTATEGANTINNTVQTTVQTSGTAAAALTLTSLTRTPGSTINFTNPNGVLGTIGTNPTIFISGQSATTASGPGSLLGGGLTVNGNDFAAYNPTYGVGALGTTGFAGYSPLLLNNAASTDNVSMGTGTGVAIGTMTVNSLRATGTVNVVQTAGTTLTVSSGGLMAGGGALTIGALPFGVTTGTATNQGNLTTTGSELFLLGGSTLTVNSAIIGSAALVKSGSGGATINGTNTYTGGTYVDQGTLTLGNSGNVTVGQSALGTGGIFLNGGNLTQTAGSLINPGTPQAVTITGNSTLTTASDLGLGGTVTTLGSNTLTVTSTNGVHVGDYVTGTGIPGSEFVTAVNPATNTVTVSTGSGVTAGTNTITFRNIANSISSLTFNNDGGSNPTLTNTGLLNITSGTITASSNNVGGVTTASVNTLTGGVVDLGNVGAPTITVNPITFNGQNLAPYQPTLAIASALQNANNVVSVTGGGNLQVSGASTFTGGVNLASNTALTIAASSTNQASGRPLTGPLGTGTLTLNSGNTLYSTGAFSVGNNVVLTGNNLTFDAPSTAAASLTLGAGSQTFALPAGAPVNINVNAPNMTGAISSTVTGAGSAIVKTGLGTLQLNNNVGAQSTFNGGVVLNAGTLLATGVGGTGTSLGTGAVLINGGVLSLHHSGTGNNSLITYGNNVQINSSQSNAFIDVNNNGANTGNTIVMGSLDYGAVTGNPTSGYSFTSSIQNLGSAAPGTVLNVTGGNGYRLQFTSSQLGANTTSPATFNVSSGLTLVLPGGFTIGTNLPTNIGPGTLVYSGSNTGGSGFTVTGTTQVSIGSGQNNTPLGTGTVTLNSGSTLQLSPYYATASAANYTPGGLTGKYFFTGQATMANAANFGIAPNSTLVGVQPNDSGLRQGPAGVNTGALSNSLSLFQGLLTVTSGGTYYFGGGSDDQMQIVVDGQLLQNDVGGGHGLNQQGLSSVSLSVGNHMVTVRGFNIGSGGGLQVLYSGPDTAGNNITGQPPVNFLQALPLTATSYATNYTSANNFQNAAILGNAIAATANSTIDGLGSDFNYAVPSLALSNGVTLTVANGTGTAGAMGNGAFVVTGLTTLGTGGTVNPTTGTLVLAGGLTDGGNGLTKTGAGTLVLASGGTFTGALNISGGFVQLQDGGGLTSGTTTIGVATTTPATLDLNGQTVATTGNIILNGGAGPASKSSAAGAGLYNSSANTASLPAGGTVSIGAATATVNAAIGGFGNINILGTLQDSVAGSALNKVGPDVLTLSNTNTFTGQFNINGGTVQLTGVTGFTSSVTNPAIVASGATVDLNGQAVATTKPLTLNGGGVTGVGAPNQLGALIDSSATAATYPGNITLNGTTAIGGPSLQPGVSGGITLTGTITGAQQITKIGGNNLTLSTGSGAETLIDVQAGSLTMNGTALIASTSNANFLRQGATLTLDNSTTATSQRLGNHGMFLSGNLVVNGNSVTAVSEIASQGGNNYALGTTFANGYGGSTITINSASTAGVTLQVASTSTSIFARAAGNTLLLRGDNLGATPGSGTATFVGSATSLGSSGNNGQSVGQGGLFGAANALIYPFAVVDTSATGVGVAFAGYNGNTNGIAPIVGTNGNAANAVTSVPTVVTALAANTTNANATVNINTAGLTTGMEVVGAGIAGGTTISAIGAGQITLSANATATANTQLSFYSAVTGGLTTPNVVSAAAANPLSSVPVAQTINSLTLNNGASSSLTIGAAGLQIDSGGILAVGTNAAVATYSISGPGILTGTNNLNRELIFHTTGTGTTLTVSAPIFVNGGGLTKADGGMLVLGAAETYTGDTVVNGGTLQLAGGNNTIFRPLTTGPTPGNQGSGATGQNLTVSFGGTLDLNGTLQSVGSLRSGSATQLAGGTIVNSNVGTPATLSVALGGNQTWAGNISNGQSIGTISGNTVGLSGSASGATLNFVRDGNNTLLVNSPNTFSGSATFQGGATQLVDLGTMQNTTSVTVTQAALIWDDTGVQAVSNRLSSTAPITLNGGGLQFRSRAGTGSTPVDAISLGALNIGVGSSSIGSQVAMNQGSALQVTFASLGTPTRGGTLNFTGGIGSASFGVGDNPRFFFTSPPTLTNGLIGPWATVTGLNGEKGWAFATYDPASGVRPLQYQPVSTFGAGINSYVTGAVTLPTAAGTPSTIVTNSFTGANATLSFNNPADTLQLQSGGLLTTNANFTFGSTTTPGQIQAGTGADLYVHVGGSTATVNSKIIDSPSGNTNVIVDNLANGNGANLTLTNANTFTGTFYDSGVFLNLNSLVGPAIPGNVILSGSTNAGTDSLAVSTTSLNQQLPNQLAATSSITINGAAQYNMGSSANLPNQNASNTQTIRNLTFSNNGGTNGGTNTGNGPTVFTGAGTLTIAGQLTSTNNAETYTVPVINGFINLTNATPIIQVDANVYSPNQVGLTVNANIATTASAIAKSGTGWLGIGGQSTNLVGTAFNLNTGGLAYSPSSGSALAILGSSVTMAAGTTIDARGNNQGAGYAGLVLGSITSSSPSAVLLNGVQGTAGNITTGLDNTSTSYAGSFASPYATGLLNVTKIGTGAWTLTGGGNTTASGTLAVSNGSVAVNAAGVANFQTYTLNTGGTLLVDNATAAEQDNRLGGAFFTTANTLAPTVRALNMQGGNLTVSGNGSTAANEALGSVGVTGGGIVTLNAGTAGVNVTLQSLAGQGAQTSLLIRGSNLGSAAGAGNATLQFANTGGTPLTPPGLSTPATQGGGANNTTTKTVRPDILVDSTANGLGQGFLTIDSATGLVRPLGFGAGITAASELATTLTTATTNTTNVSLSAVAFGSATGNALSPGQVPASVTANTLTLQSGGGVNLAIIPGNPWGANGALLTITPNADGILNVAGSNALTAGQVNTGGVTSDWHVLAGSTLTLNASINGGTGGLTKADGGTLILNQPVLTSTSQVITINGGTLQLGSNLPVNPLFYYPNGSGTPGAEALAVNNGTFDINGVTTTLGTLTTTNPLPFAGGTAASPNSVITNSSSTPATLITNNTSTVISTVFSGNLGLDKAGNTTLTLSSPQSYTGTTTVRGGTLVLRDQATLASTTINANFSELQLDNSGLANINQRVSSSAALNLTGGAFRVNPSSLQTTQNIGTVNLNGGSNLFYVAQYSNNGNNSAPTFNVANLNNSNSSSLLIDAPYSGALGNFAAANAHIYIAQLNGAPFNAGSMVNGIIGPQYLVANTGNTVNWATYSNLAGVTTPNSNGTANYGALGGGATVNSNTTANTVAIAGQTLNTLAVLNAQQATTLGLNGPLDQLVLAGGGILVNDQSNKGLTTIQGGSITSGVVNSPSTLYIHSYANNGLTLNSPIVNNGSGAVSLVHTGNATLTLTPQAVETVNLPAAASSTITVPNATGLVVGMGVTASNVLGTATPATIPAGTTILAISGTTVTLSASTVAGTTGNQQLTFAPPASTATSTTTLGSSSVTTAANAFPTSFAPTIGQSIGGPTIPGGATISSVSGTNATGFTIGFTAPNGAGALATGTTAAITVGSLSNTYTGTTTVNSTTDQYAGGTTNLTGNAGAIVIPGNLFINGGATVTMNTNQGQIAATSNITVNGSGTLNYVGTNTASSVTFNNSGGNANPTVNAATLLNLTSPTPITATNDNTGFTPQLSGTTVNFANAGGATINVSGQSLNDLTISAAITSVGAITKTGSGSLILPNANTASLSLGAERRLDLCK